MSASPVQLICKSAVAQRLGVSERTVEKLVKARKFPPPLKLGKNAVWAHEVVERWLEQVLAPQLTWEAPKRARTVVRTN
jgi:prophage regulatory protein